jgi:RNA polymerase sigma-70 factor (ECF subfamily)
MVLQGSDRGLIEGCRRGERDAFRALFETYQDKIYSIALRFSGDRALAMDIARDTFLKLFSSMAGFRRDSSFDTWVYRLVVNR